VELVVYTTKSPPTWQLVCHVHKLLAVCAVALNKRVQCVEIARVMSRTNSHAPVKESCTRVTVERTGLSRRPEVKPHPHAGVVELKVIAYNRRMPLQERSKARWLACELQFQKVVKVAIHSTRAEDCYLTQKGNTSLYAGTMDTQRCKVSSAHFW
jgi:hypothetical protein